MKEAENRKLNVATIKIKNTEYRRLNVVTIKIGDLKDKYHEKKHLKKDTTDKL